MSHDLKNLFLDIETKIGWFCLRNRQLLDTNITIVLVNLVLQ